MSGTPGPWSRAATPDKEDLIGIQGQGHLRRALQVCTKYDEEERYAAEKRMRAGAMKAIEEEAGREQSKEIVRIMWNNPAFWDAATSTKETRLAQHGSLPDLRMHLLQLRPLDVRGLHNMQRTILHIAAERGYLAMLVMLVSEFSFSLSKICPTIGNTLHIACRSGHASLVAFIVTHDDDISGLNALVPETRNTPLHHAALAGSLPVVKILEAQGVVLGALNAKHQTPLLISCMLQKEDVASFLVSRHDSLVAINTADSSSMTALYYCIKAGMFSLTKLLISKGASLTTPGLYWTPIQLAARNPDHESALRIIKYLIEDCGQQLADSEMFNNSPVAFAEQAGNAKLAAYLRTFMKPDY